MKSRRLLSIGHSYAVSLNRRLAREMSIACRGQWDVTCATPKYFHGGNDLAPIAFVRTLMDDFPIVTVDAYLTRKVHVFSWGVSMPALVRQDWDIVHAWEEPYIFAGWQIARSVRPSSKLVFFTAQSNPKRYPPPFSWFERDSMARAAGWVCCGYSIEQNLLDRPGYRRPHQMIPLGVDVEAFRPDPKARRAVREALGWAYDGPPVVGFMGRFTPAKGVRLLIKALEATREPFRVLFVGSGELEAEVREFCSRHDGRALHVAHDAVPQHINAMDMLCAPSQSTPQWREQFGRMLVEAAACGVPVLGSDSGEIPKVIGSTGLVIGESDENGWAEAISELLASPQRRMELGAAGLAQAHERYAWPIVARQYLNFFESL